MSNRHCYLCASDEGVLLDIFGDGGKSFSKKIETCLSVKVDRNIHSSTKICHKCAYELENCSQFVQKYKEARDREDSRSVKGYCSLCSEAGRKGYIFNFKDANPVDNLLWKINGIFNDSNFLEQNKNLSICLSCRYNLDVLFDLKIIYHSTSDKLKSLNEKCEKLLDIPKTRTRVVRRKTTYIPSSTLDVEALSDTDSNSTSSAMSQKRKRGRSRKVSDSESSTSSRNCGQCEAAVENGVDMYRYHRTGLTICKVCWLSMDPEKVTESRRKKLGLTRTELGTRKCAIVLKDILSNPAKFENIYKVEKDNRGNMTFIVTDDSSENEEREKAPVKRSRKNRGSVSSVTSLDSGKSMAKRGRPKKRPAAANSNEAEDEPPAKMKDKRKRVEDDKSSTSSNAKAKNGTAISDTEVYLLKMRRGASGKIAEKNERSAKSASDAEMTRMSTRRNAQIKQIKPIKSEPSNSSSKEIKTPAQMKSQRGGTAKTAISAESLDRPMRKTRANSVSRQESRVLHSRTPNSTRSGKSARNKSEVKIPQVGESETETEKEQKQYTCGICHVEYRSKVDGMQHEISHSKQLEVKLRRITVPELVVEETTAASLIEEPEDRSVASEDSKKTTQVNAQIKGVTKRSTDENESPETSEETVNIDTKRKSGSENEEEKEEEKGIQVEENEDRRKEPKGDTEDESKRDISTIEEDVKSGEEKRRDDKVEDNIGEVSETTGEDVGKKKEMKSELDSDNGDISKTQTQVQEDDRINKMHIISDSEYVEAFMENNTYDKGNKTIEKPQEIENNERLSIPKVDESEEAKEGQVNSEALTSWIKSNEKEIEVTEPTEEVSKSRLEESIKTDQDVLNTDENEEKEVESEVILRDSDSESKTADEAPNVEETKEAVDGVSVKLPSPEKKAENTSAKDEDGESVKEKDVVDVQVKEVDNAEIVDETEAKNSNTNDTEVVKRDADSKEEVKAKGNIEKVDGEEEESVRSEEVIDAKVILNEKNDIEEKDEMKNNVDKNKDIVEERDEPEDDLILQDEETTNSDKIEAGSAGVASEECLVGTKVCGEPESIVSDILTEVFHLATAEVQKRLENEAPGKEKCSTPVSETLENISREICNSADMPSLEPLVEESHRQA